MRPGEPIGAPPTLVWVDPRQLLVGESSQRDASERSIALIRELVRDWDWSRYRPPIVAATEAGLAVMDGHDTAIAGASHPHIEKIPVVVTSLSGGEPGGGERNPVTSTRHYFAALAAEDPDAKAIEEVCERANVVVLRHPPANAVLKAGETMAVASVARLIATRGADGAMRVLEIIRAADAAPVSAVAMRAVELLLFDHEFNERIEPQEITMTLAALGERVTREAKQFSAANQMPLWRGFAEILFRRRRKARTAATAAR